MTTATSGNAQNASVANSRGSRAFWPGSGRGRWGVLLALALALAAAAAVLGILVFGGGSHPNPLASLKYGQIPSWLPSAKPPPNQIVRATEASPVLAAIEGNTVDTKLPQGSAMVTAVGPAIPAWVSNQVQSGHWSDSETAPSTFTVTFARVQGAIPLSASAFQILTTAGQVIHPAIRALGGGPMPAELRPGRPLTLTMKAGLTEGEGVLRWVPIGTRVLVAWTYGARARLTGSAPGGTDAAEPVTAQALPSIR